MDKLRCKICNRILRGTRRGRHCQPCDRMLKEYRQSDLEIARLKRYRVERNEFLQKEFGTSRIKAFEYSGQELLPGGKFAITGHIPIRRQCADCAQDDREVKGNWAPAFEEEKQRVILLCWPCYEKRWNTPD